MPSMPCGSLSSVNTNTSWPCRLSSCTIAVNLLRISPQQQTHNAKGTTQTVSTRSSRWIFTHPAHATPHTAMRIHPLHTHALSLAAHIISSSHYAPIVIAHCTDLHTPRTEEHT